MNIIWFAWVTVKTAVMAGGAYSRKPRQLKNCRLRIFPKLNRLRFFRDGADDNRAFYALNGNYLLLYSPHWERIFPEFTWFFIILANAFKLIHNETCKFYPKKLWNHTRIKIQMKLQKWFCPNFHWVDCDSWAWQLWILLPLQHTVYFIWFFADLTWKWRYNFYDFVSSQKNIKRWICNIWMTKLLQKCTIAVR